MTAPAALRPADRYLAPLAAFVLLALCAFVALGGYPPGNEMLFMLVNRAGSRGDFLWQNLTSLGEGIIAFVVVASFARRDARLVWLALLAALLAGVSSQLLKHLFDMPRPAAIFDPASLQIIGATLRSHAFPSGHSTTAFVAAVLLAERFPRWRAACYTGAALVAMSRLVVGAHWPADILAGACLGYLSGLATLALASRTRCPPWLKGTAVLAWLILLVTSLWLFTFALDYPSARWMQYSIAAAGVSCALMRIMGPLRK